MNRKELWRPDWIDRSPELLAQSARVYLENKKNGEEWERISPYEMEIGEMGPNFAVDVSTEIGRLEYTALMRLRELALKDCKYIVWLSPAGGRSDYEESRMVLAIVEGIEDGSVRFNCRGIALKTDGSDLLVSANRLLADGGKSIDEICEVEDMRTNPIGFNLKSEYKWTTYLATLFGRDRVWQEIENGGDIERQRRIEMELKSVWRDLGGRLSMVNEVYLGVMIERQMAQRGFAIVGGNHGATYGDMMSNNFVTSSFNTLFSKSVGTIKPVEINGKRVCPYCGQVLENGGTVCSKCGAKFE